MKIDREYVAEKVQETLGETKEIEREYLKRVTTGFIERMLLQSRGFWKNYGMYWWNMQDVLKNYAPREYREFIQAIGGEDEIGKDDEIKKQYDYGSDMYNWVAAQLYIQDRADSMQLGDENSHAYEVPDGDIRSYIPGTGFVDEATSSSCTTIGRMLNQSTR
jgi:hypothetical protein